MSEATTATRPTRLGRIMRWAGIAAAVLVVGALLWGGYRAKAGLRAAVAAADRADPDWRLADLLVARDAVPDAENGAIPVAQAAAMLPASWPPAPTPEEAARGLTLRDAFDRATRAEGPARVDHEALAVLRAELVARADALVVARRAADFARGRYEFVLGPDVIDSKHEGANAARRVARLLQADAIVAAHDGRPDDAIRACRAMFGVGRSIGDEPTVIPQLIRGAIDRAATNTVVAILARAEPSADALAATQRDILTALAEPFERHALRGERAVAFEMYERLKADPTLFSTDEYGKRRPPLPYVFVAVWSPILDGQQALALEWSNELAAVAERPTPERLAAVEAWRARLEARKASRVGSLTGLLAILLAPAAERTFDTFMSRRAYLGAAAILLAAERRRMDAGAWPATISEIPADLLPEPPPDPYTGGPYRLARIDGGPRVYSVGPNLKDEGGACEEKKRGEDGAVDDVGVIGHDPDRRGRASADVEGFTPGPPDDNVDLKVKNSDSNPVRRDPG